MYPLDERGNYGHNLDSFLVEYSRPGAFVGTPANSRGDHDGTQDPTTIFTVTGDVLVRVFAVVTVTIVGAGTIEVGLTGNTAELLAQVANTSTMAANEIYLDATVDDVRGAAFADVKASTLVVNGSNIIETLGTANLTAGDLYYVALWRPFSDDGKVVGV